MIEQEFGWRRKDSSAAPYTWNEDTRKTATSRRPVLKAVVPPAVGRAKPPANKSYPSERRGVYPFVKTDGAVRQSEGSPITTRTSSETVVFARPFVLAGFEGTQAAGAYVVETDEELQEGVSFPVWQRRSNAIQLYPRPGVKLNAKIGTTELDAALMADGAWAGLRFESRTRRDHRMATKAFFDTIKAERIADPGAASPIAGR